MNFQRSILFAVGLSLAACADVSVGTPASDESVANTNVKVNAAAADLCADHSKLTVHIAEAAKAG